MLRLRNSQAMVEDILGNHASARNSDKLLLLHTWQRMGLELSREQAERFMEMPSPETITRIRRKLQANGKYLSTQQVARERSDREREFNFYARN